MQTITLSLDEAIEIEYALTELAKLHEHTATETPSKHGPEYHLLKRIKVLKLRLAIMNRIYPRTAKATREQVDWMAANDR